MGVEAEEGVGTEVAAADMAGDPMEDRTEDHPTVVADMAAGMMAGEWMVM